MKHPQLFNTFCPYGDANREHEVQKVRSRPPLGNTWYQRRDREEKKGIGNRGRFSAVSSGEKPAQKTQLKYIYSDCGKAILRDGWRAGRWKLQE